MDLFVCIKISNRISQKEPTHMQNGIGIHDEVIRTNSIFIELSRQKMVLSDVHFLAVRVTGHFNYLSLLDFGCRSHATIIEWSLIVRLRIFETLAKLQLQLVPPFYQAMVPRLVTDHSPSRWKSHSIDRKASSDSWNSPVYFLILCLSGSSPNFEANNVGGQKFNTMIFPKTPLNFSLTDPRMSCSVPGRVLRARLQMAIHWLQRTACRLHPEESLGCSFLRVSTLGWFVQALQRRKFDDDLCKHHAYFPFWIFKIPNAFVQSPDPWTNMHDTVSGAFLRSRDAYAVSVQTR